MKLTCGGCGRELKSLNRPHDFKDHAIYRLAEIAYQDSIREFEMESELNKVGRTHPDKEWSESVFYALALKMGYE